MIVGPAGVASRAASASPPTVTSSPTAQPPATIAGRLRKRRSATSGGMASKRDREHDPDQGEERHDRKCHDQQEHERQSADRQPLELGVLVVEGGRHELAAEQQETSDHGEDQGGEGGEILRPHLGQIAEQDRLDVHVAMGRTREQQHADRHADRPEHADRRILVSEAFAAQR